MDSFELEVNPLLSDQVRLRIMAALGGASEPPDFNTMLRTLKLSRGNFAGHVRRLEDAGLLEVLKDYVGRRPRTRYAITEKGSAELKKYLETVETLLKKL